MIIILRFVAFCLIARVAFIHAAGTDPDWSKLDDILKNGIATEVYPGCVALVGNADGILYQNAFGHYTYGIEPPFSPNGTNPSTEMNSLWDMASLSKVVATTSAVMLMYQDGYLDLDTRISDDSLLGGDYSNNGKETITIRNLMLHNSGLPADPDPFYCTAGFGCNYTMSPDLSYDCRLQIYNNIVTQKLINPVGEVYVYSDLSMMTMMFVVGKIAKENHLVNNRQLNASCMDGPHGSPQVGIWQCYYEAYVRAYVFQALSMYDTGYVPPHVDYPRCIPTENFTTSTDCLTWQVQGTVSDGNAFALGGIGGHAGLFSALSDVNVFVRELLYKNTVFNASTVKLFTTVANTTQSSRALGWNSNYADAANEALCGNQFSGVETFTHTGYTGTQICADTKHGVYTILLTNRVYPTDANGSDGINNIRELFGNAVITLMEQMRT